MAAKKATKKAEPEKKVEKKEVKKEPVVVKCIGAYPIVMNRRGVVKCLRTK